MSYPELYSDERVVLQAQNVKVKSVLFEVVLTTRRLVLIDTKKNTIPPQEINLATLKDVESGENAIRDPTITISIITISGNTRQMVLTFSKISGGERRRECDDWVRALRQNVTSTVYHPVGQAPAPKDTEPVPAEQPPAPAPHRIEITNTPPPKKRIEIARPMKKIVEAAPVMPVPVETTSLPTGSFCNRCGNRVPPESVFCNRCGTPVVLQDTGSADLLPEMIDMPPQQPAPPAEPAVPQIQITPPPVSVEAPEKKDRPIEEVIHSIEPLIEDSVPRTAPAPLVPSKIPQHTALPVETAEPSYQPQPAADAIAPAIPDDSTEVPGVLLPAVQWPVLPKTGEEQVSSSPPPAEPAPAPAQEPLPPAPSRKFSFTVIAVLALVVLAVIGGVFIFILGQPGTPEVTPTPGITVPATTVTETMIPAVVTTEMPATTPQETPSALVPPSGVWVKVSYSNIYSGEIGTPGRLRDIGDTGTHFYQISTSEGPVVVNIQKDDGSAAELAVDVYKDGELMKHSQTIAPKGLIEIQESLRAVTTTAPVAT